MKNKQPSARQCFVCGVENMHGLRLAFYDTAPGRVEASLTVPEQFQGFPGIVHGGILASILDEAATRTVMGVNGNHRIVVTASLDVRFRKPVALNEPIKVIGELSADKGEIIKASSRIEDQHGAVLASADAVLVEASAEMAGRLSLTPDIWQIFPDGD